MSPANGAAVVDFQFSLVKGLRVLKEPGFPVAPHYPPFLEYGGSQAAGILLAMNYDERRRNSRPTISVPMPMASNAQVEGSGTAVA